MRAASSSSIGTSRTNTPISHSAIGRLSTVWARIRPAKLFSSPTARAMVYQAPASATGGSIWKSSAQPRKTWITQPASRGACSDQAASVADGQAEQRAGVPTIIELR